MNAVEACDQGKGSKLRSSSEIGQNLDRLFVLMVKVNKREKKGHTDATNKGQDKGSCSEVTDLVSLMQCCLLHY